MDYPYDLGEYHFPVSCNGPEAQAWFDRGLIWTYGYNHEEALKCFRRAIEADPDCAMAWWGVAYAAGPNYNMPWSLMDAAGQAEALGTAHEATERALALSDRAAEVEAALIRALPARYPQADPIGDMTPWDDAFANSMREVFGAHPGSLEVRTVYVEALLNRTPWKMWDLAAGTPAPGADTEEAMAACEAAFAEDPAAWRHPGLLHLYVHLMEMSPYPERALKHGDVLRTLVPDAGHLIHMPTHIDVLCGHYENVVRWNEVAVRADLKFYDREGAFNIYTGYRQHNYHFVIYGAMFLGQLQPALDAVRGMAETTPDEMLRIESPPMADYFESYLGFHPHVLVRFGRWREAVDLPLPEDTELYCTLAANVLYARGVAHAALGDVAEAEAAEREFLAARARVPESRLLHNNTVQDLLQIAQHMLRGEILYRKGAHEAAYDELRAAVAAEDALPYDEPWGWMQPSRHALGALLFEQGHVAEAEAVFREDLGLGGQSSRAMVHPDNIWALRGLDDCLKARGETAERAHIAQRLALAEARADRRVAASCFCARAAMVAE